MKEYADKKCIKNKKYFFQTVKFENQKHKREMKIIKKIFRWFDYQRAIKDLIIENNYVKDKNWMSWEEYKKENPI